MEYKHFSHNHTLTLSRIQPGQQFQCHGCNLPCHDSIFACWNCNFFLHEHCGTANRYTNHPSHLLHPLVLVPSPTYCSGSFLCNGCGAPGNAFSYCCALCEVDLHVHCAYLPHKVSHNAHQHELCLSFEKANVNNALDYCKICMKEMSFRNWSYFCDKPECDFRVHTYCATNEVKKGACGDDGNSMSNQTTTMSNQNTTSVHEPQGRTEMMTQEQEMMLEVSRMHMELQMAHALSDIIAYFPR